MRLYIVDKNGDVCGDFGTYEAAKSSLENDYTPEQIQNEELEIIEGEC